MRARVYALVDVRESSGVRIDSVWGTLQEALNRYAEIKGYGEDYSPDDIEKQAVTNDTTGELYDFWTFDRDDDGYGWVSEYRLEVSEILD